MRALRNRYVFLSDILAFVAVPVLAFSLRFQRFAWPQSETDVLLVYLAISVPLKLALMLSFGMYNRIWRQAGVGDLVRILRVVALSGAACLIVGAIIIPLTGLASSRVPIFVLILDALATVVVVLLPRIVPRLLVQQRRRELRRASDRGVLIIGAGAAGEIVAKELLVLRATNGGVSATTPQQIDELIAAARQRLPDAVLREMLQAVVPESLRQDETGSPPALPSHPARAQEPPDAVAAGVVPAEARGRKERRVALPASTP